ncbi:hypothetical protein RyT2_13220 [Pseudolactococcus yaeyamensis]
MVKKYGNKQEICELFGVSLGTLSNDLTKMRREPEFSDYVLRPTHGRVYILIEGYEEYLKYCSRQTHDSLSLSISK